MKVYRVAVWGTGAAKHTTVRDGESNYSAYCKSSLRGFELRENSEDWAVDVLIKADDIHDAVAQIEQMTRFDTAIKGWTWNEMQGDVISL